jgi:hypothetical protein
LFILRCFSLIYVLMIQLLELVFVINISLKFNKCKFCEQKLNLKKIENILKLNYHQSIEKDS